MNKAEQHEMFQKMMEAEQDLFKTEFVAPLISRWIPLVTSIQGIVYRFEARHSDKGYFLWRPVGVGHAKPIQRLSNIEQMDYLKMFKSLNMIAIRKGTLCGPVWEEWICVPWNLTEARARFGIGEAVVVRLIPTSHRVQQMDVITVAVTPTLLYHCQNSYITSAALIQLKILLSKGEVFEAIIGATPEMKLAVEVLITQEAELQKKMEENRIKRALDRADAELVSYAEQTGTTYVVRWKAQGIDYRTVVQKKDLEVISAGICLSGRDRIFDLTSIVSVMKERQQRWGDDHMDTFALY